MAFAFGAAVAALTGTFAAALNGSVFPQNFEFPLLITVYTMVILGGAGSQGGVVLGAILVSVLLEVLREPGDARVLFYAVISARPRRRVPRPRSKLVVVLGGTIVLGFVARPSPERSTSWTAGVVEAAAAGGLGRRLGDRARPLAGWVAPVSYVALIALGAPARRSCGGWTRIALLVPTLYLAAFVWENVMLAKPEPTRYIVLGALLVAMMVARPDGLLGEKRVEIV